MNGQRYRLLVIVVAAALGTAAPCPALAGTADKAGEPPRDGPLRPVWRNGTRLISSDRLTKLRSGGRVMADWASYDADDTLPAFSDDAEFRRARLYVAGNLRKRLEFKAAYDFAGTDPDFKDVYIGLRRLSVGNLRIGQFKEPFGLEELTSSNYTTFMERSLPAAFAPGRNHGMMAFGARARRRFAWAAGVFRDADEPGDGYDDSLSLIGRVAGRPYQASETEFLHLGIAWRHAGIGDLLRYSSRPESHMAPRLVDTRVDVVNDEGQTESRAGFEADGANILGIEAAFVRGPVSVQGEYMVSSVDSPQWGNPSFDGYYLYVSYFLTGESRPYGTALGRFIRVKPAHRVVGIGRRGGGAWELAARYSSIDLSDSGIDGGELGDFTVGVNWYLTTNSRVMLNYVSAELAGSGETDILQTRFQIEF